MESTAGPTSQSFHSDFVAILFRPRQTMRRILDRRPDRSVIPLVLLASLSAFAGDMRLADLGRVPAGIVSPSMVLLIAGVVVGVVFCSLLFFYFLAWIAVPIGHFMEGEGSKRDVRSALAWGLAPSIAALAYRIPALLFIPATLGEGGRRIRIHGETLILGSASLARDGWGLALVFTALELGTMLWLLFVASSTMAEAHGFSRARGLGTLALAVCSPMVVIVAALLAFQ